MVPLKKDVKLVRSLQQKKFRNEHGLFIVEGKKMVEEAMLSSFKLHSLYSTDSDFYPNETVGVSAKEMEMMTAMSSPSPYLAILHKKEFTLPNPSELNGSVLILDGIVDPGNMGTMLRTAEWFGVPHVFCTKDSVELYNPKTVQSTMGSLFRVTVCYIEAEEVISFLKKNDYRIIGADMSGTSLYEFAFETKDAIVIGSESHGIRQKMRTTIDSFITVPRGGTAESLNASIAASIILSEVFRNGLKRQT